ncbi:diguanylate cyclase (GGDEF)-like protein [Pseudorhizobium tarimense]|uniref:Diguanylate cyclase (GGDEF)-like protein n=1 Tax=Pseudorhizobium tarimense TaxID=1079109 RepID=A0ABV2HCH8_9HYPH|nr:EAL domain-containing protein [Pseudorhizobium tarimense]MCJ8521347.1 EAL domain-containing protein [Pseudorhizobium tarimense]
MKAHEAGTLPTDVYLSFVSSLFGNRGTLFTGMVVHILSCFIVYGYSQANFYLWLAAVFASVFAYRLYWFRRFDRTEKTLLSFRDIVRWEVSYVYGAAATALLLGIASGYAVVVLRDPYVSFMCIAVTMASMVSIVGRNFGSPLAVSLQTLGCCVPIILACLFTQQIHLILMSLLLVPFGLTTRSMATGVRDFLYRNVLASRELARLVDRFDVALKTISHGLIMADREGVVQVANRRAPDLLKLQDDGRLEGQTLLPLLKRSLGSGIGQLRTAMERAEEERFAEALVQLPDDSYINFTVSRRSEGGIVVVFEDVTARFIADEKIRYMARYDALTGLPNAHYFRELCRERLSRGSDQACLLLLDVEGFRHVNDVRGHRVGDGLLQEVARRLSSVSAHRFVIARMIGDRFAILITGDAELDLFGEASSLHAAVQGSYSVDDHSLSVSVNGGYVLLPNHELSMEQWEIKADLALNDSKLKGNGALSCFLPEMDAIYFEGQRLRADLRQALRDKQLTVVYQPMYLPDGSAVESCEALVRWTHPQKGPIAPNIFVPLAEDMGIVSEISRYVMDQACRDCASWPEPVAVSVNLSVHDLRSADVVGWVTEALEEHKLPAQRLHVEVTESFFMDDPAAVCTILERLRSIGVTISIDDFGTGFSSLSYLDSLPLDIVKIDRAFVRDIGMQSKRMKLLRGIVQLTRELGLTVVLEGVETKQQLALINKYGLADVIQGYVFSAPVSPTELVTLLSENSVRKEAVGGAG